jgi:hypothetical protein
LTWPPDYAKVWQRRVDTLKNLDKASPGEIAQLKEYYKSHPEDFIEDWCVTIDPRNAAIEGALTFMPFCLFPRQREAVRWLYDVIFNQRKNGVIDKCRDVGITWLCSAFSVWIWLYYPDAAVGWGSRKQDLVDKKGDPKSIFEKIRSIIEALPKQLLPKGYDPRVHDNFCKILNPENGATICGEAGDNIGRGGRTLAYFKDEAAFYERPALIEASLGRNTESQIDLSTHNGTATVFYRKTRTYPAERIFTFDWWEHPAHDEEWLEEQKYYYCEELGMPHLFAQEIMRDASGSIEGQLIPPDWVRAAVNAAERLGYTVYGDEIAALDVADEGGDKNALCKRYGFEIEDVITWGKGTTTETTDKAIAYMDEWEYEKIRYDSIGVGAGVKGTMKLRNKSRQYKIDAIGWNGAKVYDKKLEFLPGKRNEDMFSSGRAQAWWDLRIRFMKTYEAIELDEVYAPDELISLSPNMRNLGGLIEELSQPTYTHNSQGKIVIDKKPEGAKSPNMADSVVMAYARTDEKKITKTRVKGLY